MSHPIILPIVTVQHDAPTVISEVDSGLIASEDIWVSCYKTGEPSVHGKVRVSLDEYDRSLVRFDARDGVDMSRSQVRSCLVCNVPWLRLMSVRVE